MNVFGHLRKSEKRILEVLANSNGKRFTQKEIIKQTKLSKRTVKYALSNLIVSGHLVKRPVLSDMRSKLYFLVERGESG